MLHYKIERAIFITIFVIGFFVVGSYATDLKYNVLPINKGLTPEQVIEQEFPQLKYNDLDYYYKIIDDFLFVCMETENGHSRLEIAFRNPNSGFMFDVDGFLIDGPNYRCEIGIVDLGDKSIFYCVYKYNNGYIIELSDIVAFEPSNITHKDIDVYFNEEILTPFTLKNTRDQYWVAVVNNLDEINEVYCYYQDQRIHIFNADEIRVLFGEEQQ